jgi:hypothetical protein
MTHIFLLPLGKRVTFTKLYGVCNQYSAIEMNACYSPAVVEDALLCPTLGRLLLFLLFDLGGLRLDLAGTSERAVNWKRGDQHGSRDRERDGGRAPFPMVS